MRDNTPLVPRRYQIPVPVFGIRTLGDCGLLARAANVNMGIGIPRPLRSGHVGSRRSGDDLNKTKMGAVSYVVQVWRSMLEIKLTPGQTVKLL